MLKKIKNILSLLKPANIWSFTKASFQKLLDLSPRKILGFFVVIFKSFWKLLKFLNPIKLLKNFNYKKVSKIRFISSVIVLIFFILSLIALIIHLLDGSYEISQTAGKEYVSYNSVYAPSDSYIYQSGVTPSSLSISFPSSVANHALLDGKNIEKGISINPEIRGVWRYSGSYMLYLTPEKDWIPNTKYSVKLNDEIFSNTVEVASNVKDFTFSSPTFKGFVSSSDFYEDPRNIKNKHVIATFKFNYPINKEDLVSKVSIKSYNGEKYSFTIKEDELPNIFHISTEPVRIKSKEDFVEIKVSGIQNAYNKTTISSPVVAKVTVPSSSTFFKIYSINSQIMNNESKNNEPEQILSINFSTSVSSTELSDYVEFYKFDKQCYNLNSKLKDDTDPLSISGVSKINPEQVSKIDGKMHMFKYDITTRNSCIITKIKKGLSSIDGFIIDSNITRKNDISNYPMEAKIAFEGSILSLKGDKTLSLSSRGVDDINVKVSRIDSKDLNHLVSQTSGDFSHPYFRESYTFNEDNIAENFEKTLKINSSHPAKVNYSSVNLGEYFKDKKGMFLVKVVGKNSHSTTSEDKRFVLITDLGIVVKKNLDESQNVFVASFAEGTPISGAKVQVLGKNGVPVLESYTNGVGMAQIPDFSSFKNEKQAVVFMVTSNLDVSFMPVNKYDRLVDNSKFDIEGEYESNHGTNIKGYMFSDRGIYRPGENAKIGIMVRDKNLQSPNKVPFEVDIINSRGDNVFNKKINSDEFGLLDISYDIPASAPVGSYTVTLYDISDKNSSYRKHIYSTIIKVEEFAPDSMKIKLALEKTTTKGWYKEKEIKAVVNLQNLYGNPAIEHEIRSNIELTPMSFYFKEFSDYIFKDPLLNASQTQRSFSESLDTKNTDKKGEAEYVINLDNFDRGTYSLSVNAFGYELEGGRSVSTSQTKLVSPLDYIVGYKTDGGAMYGIAKNAERSVNFIAIDNELNKISKDGLSLKIVKIDYVSSLVEMENGTYKYQNIPVEKTITEKSIDMKKTGNKLELDTKTSGAYYVLILDKDGTELSRVDYVIEGGANTNYMLDKDANLNVTLDKKQYNNGDTISMKIVAPYEGYGLITIERDKVYNYKWFKTSSKTTTEEIKLPFTVEGNAYINVSFIRSSTSREIFMPPMTYSVVAFDINKDKRTVKIDLEVPKVVKPGEDLVIKYKASKSGKIILYGVNQGILQVSKYKLPNPVAEFIKKKSLNTKTYQIMDLIMPDMRLLDMYKATGGDDSYDEANLKAQKNPFARKQDEVVAFWSGVIDVEEGYNEYTYKVPAIFNGQIKVMAVAVSETAFGSGENSVFARGDFALVPSAPFNVSPNDEFDVGTSIANMVEGSGNDYEVKVVLDPSSGFEVSGDKEQVLKISENDEKSVKFRLKALDKLGSNTIKFKVTGVNDVTKNFEMPYHIGVRPASPFVTKMKMGYEEGKLKLKDYPMPMYEEYRKQEVVASVTPLVLADGILRFLETYPHMCSEQMISRTYPAMEIFFNHPEMLQGTDIYKLFDTTVALLGERQKLDGGISLWTYEGASTDRYVSLYAYDFLSRAEVLGFNVPKGMLNRLTTYTKSAAGLDATSLNDTNPAYAIYLLSRNGENTSTYLVNAENVYKTYDSKKWTSSLSGAYLASSYKMMKNEDKSRELLGKYKYGESSLRDNKYIHLMATYFPDDIKPLDKKVVKALLEPLKEQYLTTNMSAHSLFALSSYAMTNDKNIVIEGKEVDYSSFARAKISSSDKLITVSAQDPFYYSIREQGYSRKTGQKAQSNFVEVSKEILNDKGSVVTSAKVGDELIVRIRANAYKKDYIDNVAITDLLSGGFEMVLDSVESSSNLDNSEAREDRALIYLGLNKNITTISYKVKAIAKGKFAVPATYAEALYDSDVRANSKGFMFTVE